MPVNKIITKITYALHMAPSTKHKKVTPKTSLAPVAVKEIHRRRLFKGALASLVGVAALTPKPAQAMVGLTAGAVAALQTFLKESASDAIDNAKESAMDMVTNWEDMFSSANNGKSEEGSLNRTTEIAIADAERASNRDARNKRITAATQASPTICSDETLTKVIFNEAPRVKRVKAQHGKINLNAILSNNQKEQATKLLQLSKFDRASHLRKRFSRDEHLDSSVLLKKGTLSKDEQEQAEANLIVSVQPFEGTLISQDDSELGREVGVNKEAKRQSLKAMLSDAQNVRVEAYSRRTGTEANFEAVETMISQYESSMDSRDRIIAVGLQRSLDKSEASNGRLLSPYEMNTMLTEQRSTPEYQEAIQNYGAEPVPYIKEIINIENTASNRKIEGFLAAEGANALLANLLQLEIENSLVSSKPMFDKLG